MACRGVHFALRDDEAHRLLAAKTDEELWSVVYSIESNWDCEWLQQTDKSWDAIHRCLTDGTLEFGHTPLHRAIFGDKNLHVGNHCHVSLVGREEVKEVAKALGKIDKAWMHERFMALDPDDYEGTVSEEEFEYIWGWFVPLRQFFERAASANRWVSFTVSY